jgi:hypothetical protein
MTQQLNVRWAWLKGMYIYTIIGAGGFGLGVIVAPDEMRSLFGLPGQDAIHFGVAGSVWLSFGLLAILGLRSPLKFVPILLLQLCYKALWFVGVIFPMLLAGKFPTYAALYMLLFAIAIIGDLIAIPFSYIFARQEIGELTLQRE